MDEIEFGDEPSPYNDIETGQHNFTRDYDYDFSEVNEYSDISIMKLDLSCDVSYRINDHFRISGNYTYLYYDDKELYLYDGSGNAHIGRISMSYIL